VVLCRDHLQKSMAFPEKLTTSERDDGCGGPARLGRGVSHFTRSVMTSVAVRPKLQTGASPQSRDSLTLGSFLEFSSGRSV
jgi:hypothetical protein